MQIEKGTYLTERGHEVSIFGKNGDGYWLGASVIPFDPGYNVFKYRDGNEGLPACTSQAFRLTEKLT